MTFGNPTRFTLLALSLPIRLLRIHPPGVARTPADSGCSVFTAADSSWRQLLTTVWTAVCDFRIGY
jgi:hypothetical protein